VSEPQFFVFCVDGVNSFYHCDDDGVPVAFDAPDDAVTAAKGYSGELLILRSVAKVTQRTTYRVETIK
jgi:hypothetical protein